MPKITPFLWFHTQAEEAMNFYVAVFRDAKAGTVLRYGEAGPGPAGTVMLASFELEGQAFTALNGGPQFPFTEAVSFVVDCADQGEVDHYWERLGAGGEPGRCGWLKDRFGVSWQIVPALLPEFMSDPDPARRQRVMAALMPMTKIDIATLRRAHAG